MGFCNCIDRYEKCIWLSFSVRMTNIECTHVHCAYFVCVFTVRGRLEAVLLLKECVIPDQSVAMQCYLP